MPLEVTPRATVMYPDDVQRFVGRGAPPASGWRLLTGAIITALGELESTVSNATDGNIFSARLLHVLRGGFGEFTLTLDSLSIPTTGYIVVDIFDSNTLVNFTVQIEDNTTELGLVNMTGDDGIVSHTAAVGDIFKFMVEGNRWSYQINGVEKGYAIPDTPVSYPVTVHFYGSTKFAAAPPHIAPIALTGDWTVEGVDATWTEEVAAGGVSLAVGDPFVDYTARGLPGNYTIVAEYGGSALQQASALVQVPTLIITTPRPVEVEPTYASGALVAPVILFSSNYAAAQTFQLVTWSETGSGAFDNPLSGIYGRYTAPTTAGDTTVTASVAASDGNEQKDTVTVTVKEVLLPDIDIVAPAEVIIWKTNMSGTNNWAVSAGTINSSDNSTLNWTAPSGVGSIVRVQVTNATTSHEYYADVEVLDSLPVPYSIIQMPFEEGAEVLTEYPRGSRRPQVRVLSPAGFTPKDWEIECAGLTPTQYDTLKTFHDTYFRAGGRFFFTDYARSNTREAVRFDSKLSGEPAGDCLLTARFKLRRA